jgi:predicted DNA-binding transcriptional regulator AlpA
MQNHTNNFLNTPQTADFLGLKPGTLEVWRVQGKGPAFVKLGHAVRYRIDDLENWIDKRTRQNTSQSGMDLHSV